MNRIYQGRVKHVELLKEKTKKGEDPLIRSCSKEESAQLLWDFHELFQNAVNYYSVCLMAMASSSDNPIFKIRKQIDDGNPEHQVWKPFQRKGQKRRGMCEIARYFGLDPKTATFEECCDAALKGNDSPKELLDLALLELLEESASGDIRNTGKEMFPRFCSPKYNSSYPLDKQLKKQAQQDLSIWFYENTFSNEELLKKLKFEYFANINRSNPPKKGDDAKSILLDGVSFLSKQECISPDLEATLKMKIDQLDESLEFPSYTGGSVNKDSLKKKFYIYLLLQYVEPSTELWRVLKTMYPEPKKTVVAKKEKLDFFKFGSDPIQMARENEKQRGFVFKAFTASGLFGSLESKEPVWRDLDMIAFIESLKAFHQIEQKDAERKKEKEKKLAILDYMLEGKGNLKKMEADESFEKPPLLKGDPRIQQIEKVLLSLASASDLREGEVAEYGLRERTIRGFEKLAEMWNKVKVETLTPEEAQRILKEKLTELQINQKETMGSALLFEKLMEPENWIIWKEVEEIEDENRANNPLKAYVQKLKLEEEIVHLSEPIRFTPADSRYSVRQYQIGDKNTFGRLTGMYHHEQNALAVVAPLAVKDGNIWKKQRVRIHYAAPRFLRDGLRNDVEDLKRMPWLQPMMKALNLDVEFPQDLHNFPVFLMPKKGRKGESLIYLNFPITLDENKIVECLGKKERWDKQFAGGKNLNIYLRWPKDDWPKGWKENAWFKSFKPFTLVAVDLGVRDAGALVRIECRPDQEFYTSKGAKRHCRLIGEADGREWYAAVVQTKLLRLPGEDARVWRNGSIQQELYGEKGRKAKEQETNEAKSILATLGYADLLDETNPESSFFATQNRTLLLGLRWAQGRLRNWQSLSWKLQTKTKEQEAKDALLNEERFSKELTTLISEKKWNLVSEQLELNIEALKNLLSQSLEQIANRVVPLRGRNWEWVQREDGTGYILRQMERGSDKSKTLLAGQRGLSIERIELIEELRKRCQSLNKALRHTPGTKPRLGFGTKGIEAPDPCPDILEKLEHLREQRVKQTAHLILAEALGVQLKPHSISKIERMEKDIHGEYEKVRNPVDFIVLEDLNRYLTDQGRSRRENSRLMKWCHRSILETLKQLRETYGIPVLETAAAYSSKFSAKDGTAGFRAVELSLKDKDRYPWKKMIEKKDIEVIKLFQQLEEIGVGSGKKLLAPINGGPLFVPMNGSVVQADINAAINLGLRAVAAPNILEIHHKIRTESDGKGSLKPKTKSKREIARWEKKPASFSFDADYKIDRNSNCFPLVNFKVDFGHCTLSGQSFATGKGLWGTIKQQQWMWIHTLNKERIIKNGWGDQIPM